jgi:hypothetical protein
MSFRNIYKSHFLFVFAVLSIINTWVVRNLRWIQNFLAERLQTQMNKKRK